MIKINTKYCVYLPDLFASNTFKEEINVNNYYYYFFLLLNVKKMTFYDLFWPYVLKNEKNINFNINSEIKWLHISS